MIGNQQVTNLLKHVYWLLLCGTAPDLDWNLHMIVTNMTFCSLPIQLQPVHILNTMLLCWFGNTAMCRIAGTDV